VAQGTKRKILTHAPTVQKKRLTQLNHVIPVIALQRGTTHTLLCRSRRCATTPVRRKAQRTPDFMTLAQCREGTVACSHAPSTAVQRRANPCRQHVRTRARRALVQQKSRLRGRCCSNTIKYDTAQPLTHPTTPEIKGIVTKTHHGSLSPSYACQSRTATNQTVNSTSPGGPNVGPANVGADCKYGRKMSSAWQHLSGEGY